MVVSPYFWMVNVVLQGVWILYRIKIDESDQSLPLLAFRREVVNVIFLKYSEESRLSSSHVEMKYPIRCLLSWPKHYQAQSEHRRIQNHFKHLRWSVFAYKFNGLKSVTDACYDCIKHYQIQSEHRCIQNPFKHLRWSAFAYKFNSLKSMADACWRRYVKCKSTWCMLWKLSMILAKLWQFQWCAKFNNIFIRLFWNSFGSFFLFFPIRMSSVTFNIEIDLKIKHS